MKKKAFMLVGLVILLLAAFLIAVLFSRNADEGDRSIDTSASASVDQNDSTVDSEEWDSAEGNTADPESAIFPKATEATKKQQNGSSAGSNSVQSSRTQTSGGNSSLEEGTIPWKNTSGFDEGEWDIVG